MRSKFDEQLKKLNEEMMHMGSMIEESIQKAIEAFIHQDADSAKAIMEGDSEIDREQKKIESLCFDLLMQLSLYLIKKIINHIILLHHYVSLVIVLLNICLDCSDKHKHCL